jgi:hypothetical protein
MHCDDGTPRTKQVTTNIVIDVDEPSGTAASRSFVVLYRDGEPAAEATGAQPKQMLEQAVGLDAPVLAAAGTELT